MLLAQPSITAQRAIGYYYNFGPANVTPVAFVAVPVNQWVQPLPVVQLQLIGWIPVVPVVGNPVDEATNANAIVGQAQSMVMNTNFGSPVPGNNMVWINYPTFTTGQGLPFGGSTVRVQEVAQIHLDQGYEGYGPMGWLPVHRPTEYWEGEGATDTDMNSNAMVEENSEPEQKICCPIGADEAHKYFALGEQWMNCEEIDEDGSQREFIFHNRRAIRSFAWALRELKKFIPSTETDMEYKVDVEILIRSRLATAYFNVGNLKSCVEQCGNVLSQSGNYAHVGYLLAKAQLGMRQYFLAYDSAEKAVMNGFTGGIEELKHEIKKYAILDAKLNAPEMLKNNQIEPTAEGCEQKKMQA